MTTRGCASSTAPSSIAGRAGLPHDRSGAHTHAMICRLAPGAEPAGIARQFRALAAQLAGITALVHTQGAGETPASVADTSLCVDRVPFSSTSATARHRRAREAARPLVVNAGQVVRATILQYNDGERDLVLVGDRAQLDQRTLYLAAAACLSPAPVSIPIGRTAPQVHTPSDIDALVSSSFSPVPDREGTLFETGVSLLELPLDAHIAPECWLAALGLVLSRCHAIASPAVASLQEWDDPAMPDSPLMAGYRLVNLPSDAEAGIADTVEQARLQLQHAPWLDDALMIELNARCNQPVDIGVGMLFPAALPFDANAASYEYLACPSLIFPLTLVVGSEGDPRVSCHFDTSIHTASSVEWMLHSLAHTASRFAQGTGSVAGIELLSAQAQQRVAALGRGPDLPPADHLRVEEAFRRVAAEHPGAIALSSEEETLTYAHLDELSSRLATVLAGRGVVRDSFVGICLRRSVPVVVAMLAILKCGGVYVPMDPDYPDDRLRYTAEDAGLKLVITEAGTFPGATGTEAVAIGDLIDLSMAMPADLSVINGQDSDAAYVIYTSGSTGRPKGVLIPHGNVMSLIRATRERFAFSPTDAWTLFHSSAFDFSVWEIWGCLLTGGHLVIVSHDVSRDPDQFRDLINRKSISVLNQTPSAFYQLIEADQRKRVGDSLRLVIFGGEALDTRSLLPWFDRHPESRCRLVNMFGITETTVHVTWQDIGRGEALAASRSVGCPIPGWHVYIMDEGQHLLPPGSIGEIHVGGAGVACCYHNRPDLTPLRFMRDPYMGSVMYRSGDRGRLRSDGTLEHLGRLDSQIKLRGFRIELDEIRRVILGHPSVKAAAVLLNQPDKNDTASARIDAYVVAEDVAATELREHASRFLPEHMIPSTLTLVMTMPMTVNGKLDVEQLRGMQARELLTEERASRDDDAASDAARLMLSIWQGALGCRIDMDDNFFDLGGNSLIAIRIASAMRKEGLPLLPMSELYTHQTVRNLVAALSL